MQETEILKRLQVLRQGVGVTMGGRGRREDRITGGEVVWEPGGQDGWRVTYLDIEIN